MGNLHDGHLALVKRAQSLAPETMVTIFVNPMQFGPNEDLDNYPRTLEDDLQKLAELGVDYVFTPTNKTIYPAGLDAHTKIIVPEITELYCGANRPGHYTGVATIVAKLFNLIRPDVAIFGKKDFQQLAVIRKMVNELGIQVSIDGVETVREQNGLAMSSRNNYLTDDERQQASAMYQQLMLAKSQVLDKSSPFIDIEASCTRALNDAGFNMEYFSIAEQVSLKPAREDTSNIVILAAGRLGKTRLIDNVDFSTKN
jgi:pantoate--beta-alanine ligase